MVQLSKRYNKHWTFEKFRKKDFLKHSKTFQCNDFHNIFELTTETNKAENHLSKKQLQFNEDMYVAIPIWVMKDSLIF